MTSLGSIQGDVENLLSQLRSQVDSAITDQSNYLTQTFDSLRRLLFQDIPTAAGLFNSTTAVGTLSGGGTQVTETFAPGVVSGYGAARIITTGSGLSATGGNTNYTVSNFRIVLTQAQTPSDWTNPAVTLDLKVSLSVTNSMMSTLVLQGVAASSPDLSLTLGGTLAFNLAGHSISSNDAKIAIQFPSDTTAAHGNVQLYMSGPLSFSLDSGYFSGTLHQLGLTNDMGQFVQYTGLTTSLQSLVTGLANSGNGSSFFSVLETFLPAGLVAEVGQFDSTGQVSKSVSIGSHWLQLLSMYEVINAQRWKDTYNNWVVQPDVQSEIDQFTNVKPVLEIGQQLFAALPTELQDFLNQPGLDASPLRTLRDNLVRSLQDTLRLDADVASIFSAQDRSQAASFLGALMSDARLQQSLADIPSSNTADQAWSQALQILDSYLAAPVVVESLSLGHAGRMGAAQPLNLTFNTPIHRGVGHIVLTNAQNPADVRTFDIQDTTHVFVQDDTILIRPMTNWAPATTYQLSIEGGTLLGLNGVGNAVLATSAGIAVDVAPTASVASMPYFWRGAPGHGHALVSGVDLGAHAITPGLSGPQSSITLQQFEVSSPGAQGAWVTAEVWMHAEQTVQNFDFQLALPGAQSASFTASETMKDFWVLPYFNAQTDVLSVAGLGMAGVSQPDVLLGTIRFQTASGVSTPPTVDLLGGHVVSDSIAVAHYAAGGAGGPQAAAVNLLGYGAYAVSGDKAIGADVSAVTSADAMAALKMAMGLSPNTDGTAGSAFQFLAADVAGAPSGGSDGKVSVVDALAILKMSVGDPLAPMAQWRFVDESTYALHLSRSHVAWPEAAQVSVVGAINKNLVGLIVGDVDGSWAPANAATYIESLQPNYFTDLAAKVAPGGSVQMV